jgi:hypothetical protein
MKYIISVTIFLFTIHLNGQEKSQDYKKSFQLANQKYDREDYYGALIIYQKLYILHPEDKELNFQMGLSFFYTNDFEKSENSFLNSSSSISPELFRYKAKIAHINLKFKKAINYYNAYKLISGDKELTNEEVNRLILKTKFAELAIKNPRNVLIQNVGPTINSEFEEFMPLISADEEQMLFTSRRPNDSDLDENRRPYQSIYISNKNKNIWTSPKLLKEGINTPKNDACVGFSADGQLMFLLKESKDHLSSDLYESRMGVDDWENPTPLGSNINSKYNENSVSITIDDKVMYFSSDRIGGFGGKDLYKVLRLPNGKWSKAINLGPTINTPYDEDTPFIDTDKKTLYFSSKGHRNMGGYDIFKTVIEKRIWSQPENLNYPINTVNDDLFFVIAASGKVGYYSTYDPNGFGNQDICRILFKDENVKKHVLNAQIVSKKEEKPLSGKVILIENESEKVKGIYKSNNNTGKFILLVDPEKSYNIVVESDNYHTYSAILDFNINSNELFVFPLKKK